MHEELNNFARNEVWELVKRPSDHNVIGTKWVFQNKQDENGIIVRNKARLVAQGYSQVEGLDFDEIFAPIVRLEAIWILLAYATSHNIKLYQMDAESAFLNGKMNELVYVEQPPGFKDSKKPNHVYKLSKALYGLKQAPYPGMRDFGTFYSQRDSKLERWTPPYLLRRLEMIYLYVKSILIISYLAQPIKNFVKNLVI
jgi:hypothetical protein